MYDDSFFDFVHWVSSVSFFVSGTIWFLAQLIG